MYFSDHGKFYDGDIHDAREGLHKWAQDASRGPIEENVRQNDTFAFTFVRNPYSRLLSSFFDKICGIQRNGQRYRGNLIPQLAQTYGVDVEGEFDQIAMFRRFALFVRDTIRFRKPMDPDIHWSSMSGHVSTFIANGGSYDRIFWTEKFDDGMAEVLANVPVKVPVDLTTIPRFNESEGHGPKRAHPVEDFFDDLTKHLVYEIYKRDFVLFKYDFENPSNRMPIGEIDLDEVHRTLSN